MEPYAEETNVEVQRDTWVRTIVLIFTLLNQLLVSMNYNPLPWSEDRAYEYVSSFATVAVSIWTYWKNNSWTKPAIRADRYLEHIKAQQTLK
jgi:SPP1 family holin